MTVGASSRLDESPSEVGYRSSVGRISSSLTAIRSGRVTMYVIAAATSSDCSRSKLSNCSEIRLRISGRLWEASSVSTRAGLDQRDADVAVDEFLAQRLAERPDPEFGEAIDAAAVASDPPGGRADLDNAGDASRLVLSGAEQVRQRRGGAGEQGQHVELAHL